MVCLSPVGSGGCLFGLPFFLMLCKCFLLNFVDILRSPLCTTNTQHYTRTKAKKRLAGMSLHG